VYVSAEEDGSDPVIRVADWQTAARDFRTTLHRSLGDSPLDSGLIADVAQVYLAPESGQEFADPVDLDVFGLGSLAYLLLTGRPPAERRSALVDRLAGEGGLHPYAVADGVSAALDELVFQATAADVRHRPVSADEFLRLLDAAEVDAAIPEPAGAPVADPLTVQPGQPLDGTLILTGLRSRRVSASVCQCWSGACCGMNGRRFTRASSRPTFQSHSPSCPRTIISCWTGVGRSSNSLRR
jgi:hypothetical protein